MDSAIELRLFEISYLMAYIEETRDCFGIDSWIDYRIPLLFSMDSLIIDSLTDSLRIDSLICDSFSNESLRYSYSSTTISYTIETD